MLLVEHCALGAIFFSWTMDIDSVRKALNVLCKSDVGFMSITTVYWVTHA